MPRAESQPAKTVYMNALRYHDDRRMAYATFLNCQTMSSQMSPPTKTPLRKLHLDALASVNDQMCLTLFMHEDAAPRWNEKAVAADPGKLTRDVFKENRFAGRINVSMSSLFTFREANLNVSLCISVAFAVERLLFFIESSLRHWADISQSSKPTKDPIDESLQEALNPYGKDTVDPMLMKTIKYLRLRRNHIIHEPSELSNEYEKLIKHDAKRIQKFWQTRTAIPELDFGDEHPRNMTSNEAISLIKLARICLEEIDVVIASLLEPADVLNKINAEILSKKPELSLEKRAVIDRRIRKVRTNAKERYGMQTTLAEVAGALGKAS